MFEILKLQFPIGRSALAHPLEGELPSCMVSALSAALLAGGVTALVGLFCIGLVKDT